MSAYNTRTSFSCVNCHMKQKHKNDEGEEAPSETNLMADDQQFERFSHQYVVNAGLCDLLFNNFEVEHHLCEGCTDCSIDLIKLLILNTEHEVEDYTEYLNKLNFEQSDETLDELEAELAKLQQEEKKLEEDIGEFNEEKRTSRESIAEKEALERKRKLHEARELSKLAMNEDEISSLQLRLLNATLWLKTVQDTNVFSACFKICDEGTVGVINNFSLDHSLREINAAWGQAALLLTSLAKLIGLEFEKYRIVAYASRSHLVVLEDGQMLPLFNLNELMQQLEVRIKSIDATVLMPYEIKGGVLEDKYGQSYSIRKEFNSEEGWQKALKYMLRNLQCYLCFVSVFLTEDTHK
ncbi:beclin-1-like protein isoform X2 [Cloeon dipterum]|uniref:beclin-1-like protein isoform X2 n=1 Tax=Cloeon dipterum TaxID=197152 RepID=UPI0032205649